MSKEAKQLPFGSLGTSIVCTCVMEIVWMNEKRPIYWDSFKKQVTSLHHEDGGC